ncbi:MAG: YebC/PmpR family DNA-binding transcriptional regulator [Bacteroidia bacterium]|jgi:YebC/PmpR family DNA-binding regulatory protein|nr:YebC/PmpR family DNA-binding transcriptional regulator [Bacteroidia bacterium]
MAGHSKWANIKHRKGAQDKRRGKLFTRLLKEIMIAAKEGLPDPDANPRLRLAIQNAKGANIPKDNISRAIDKASGKEAESYIEPTYEGYAPGGVAVFVECATDNLNRTVQDVRMVFNKYGGNLGTNGSLAFVFDRMGVFEFSDTGIDEEQFTLEMIDANASEIEHEEGRYLVYVPYESFGDMQKKLESLGIEAESAGLQRIAKDSISLELNQANKVMKLIDALEDLDDVQQVYHNLELTEELASQLS